MTATPDDRAKFFEQLRASTARLLKLDVSNLTPSEAVRVDRAVSLRLTLDRFQTEQLAGHEIDVKAFVLASQELERTLGGDPERPTSAFATHESQLKLRALIEAKLMPIMNAAEEEEAAPASPTAGEEEAAEPPPPLVEAELMPEGEQPPVNTVHVTYVDAGVLDDQQQPSPLHEQHEQLHNRPIEASDPATVEPGHRFVFQQCPRRLAQLPRQSLAHSRLEPEARGFR